MPTGVRADLKDRDTMGDVAVSYKIFVDDPAALTLIREGVAKFAQVQYSREEELGFGIKILRLTVLMDDAEGGAEKTEERIRALPHVSELEVETVTRV